MNVKTIPEKEPDSCIGCVYEENKNMCTHPDSGSPIKCLEEKIIYIEDK